MAVAASRFGRACTWGNARHIVMVPQHKWLWSWTHEQAKHKCRYDRRDRSENIAAAGFEMLRTTSSVTTLLRSQTANAVCDAVMRIDEALIDTGVSLPVGGSLLSLVRKT